jgi:hypothetical protein
MQPLFNEWQPAISRGRPLVPETQTTVRIDLTGEQDALPAQTRFRS